MPKQAKSFESRYVKAESGCWLWIGPTSWDGYGRVWSPEHKEMVGAHRHAYELYVGPIGEGLQVMHSCDQRLCVSPKHLSLGTLQDNVDDMVRKGRQPRGESHGHARLNEFDAWAIRFWADVSKPAEQAAIYGVGDRAVRLIREGKRWRTAGRGRVAVEGPQGDGAGSRI